MNPRLDVLQPDAPTYWGGWPQTYTNHDTRYNMVDGVGTLPYNSPTGPCEPAFRPAMASQYFSNNPYASLPLATTYVPNPNYHTLPTNYTGISSYEPAAPVVIPHMGRPCEGRRDLPTITAGLVEHIAYPQGAGEPYTQENRSPSVSIKADPHPSPTLVVAHRSSVPWTAARTFSRTTTPVPSVRGKCPPESDNPVDRLMLVIQSKPNTNVTLSNAQPLLLEDKKDAIVTQDPIHPPAHDQLVLSTAGRRRRAPVKRFPCDTAGCDKRFAQKTQLKFHKRTHTGEKPYACGWPGCDARFPQPGNRKTHRRGHTGERPYKCRICGKGFPQGGNVKPHELTHSGVKPYVCKLDDCHNKPISTKGNLKGHQTKFHRKTLEALTKRFSEITDWNSASKADREMCQYLASVHNNLNKGIKGCKGRRIRRATPPGSPESTPPMAPTSMVSYNSQQYETFPGQSRIFQPIPPMNLYGPSVYGGSHPTSYCLGRQNVHVNIRRYDMDNEMASPTSTATYDDEQEQQIVFGHRIY